MLEKNINIRASDYRFEDKKKYYLGFTNDKGKVKNGTIIAELQNLAKTLNDYKEDEIIGRKESIIESFIQFIVDNNLSM